MATREIRVGKITGLSSYQLAIKNGTFTGTLTEYLNKEQQYYNDMVAYGDELREYVDGLDIKDAARVINTVGDTDISTIADGTLTGAVSTLAEQSILYIDFDSSDDMSAWLSDEANKKSLKVGDLVLIDDETVPNYWITDVYDEANTITGYFYRISKLGGTGEGGSGDGVIRITQADYDALKDKTGVYCIIDAVGDSPSDMLDQITDIHDDVALINQTLGYTKKNLLKNIATTQTIDGVTFTINDDGSITANGTAVGTTNTAVVKLDLCTTELKKGVPYIISGCPSGGGDNTYKLILTKDGEDVVYDYGDGIEHIPSEDQSVKVRIDIVAGYTAENLTFYPMIRSANIKDDTYEPYVDDVKTLIDNKANISELSKYALVTDVETSVQTAVSNLVDSAPDTMDTLRELATAIQNHQGVTDTLNSAITNKVDKVGGMGLSTNDYTTTEKNKLAGIAVGATNVTVDSSLSASSTNAVQNKAVASKISSLESSINTLDTNLNVKVSSYDSSTRTLYLVSV